MSAIATATPRRSILRRSGFRRMPSFFLVTSWAIVGVVIFMALFGAGSCPTTPTSRISSTRAPRRRRSTGSAPTRLGRDIFSRIIAGAPSAITGPLVVALTGADRWRARSGSSRATWAAPIDMVIQRFVDFMFALPGLLIAIVIVGVVGGGYWMAVLVLEPAQLRGRRPHHPRRRAGATSPAVRRGGANAGGAAPPDHVLPHLAQHLADRVRERRARLRARPRRALEPLVSRPRHLTGCARVGAHARREPGRSCSRTRPASWRRVSRSCCSPRR